MTMGEQKPGASKTPEELLREKMHQVEAKLRDFLPELEALDNAIGDGKDPVDMPLNEREKFAVSLAILYTHASATLSRVGSPTGSLHPGRN
jgi:hypothetical protein